MNEPQPTVEQKPAPRRSWFRRIFIFLLLMAGSVAGFYTFENWRGNRAWKEYEQVAKAKGTPLDWRTDWPKRSPTPQPLSQKESETFGRNFNLANQLMPTSVVDSQFEDLVAWEQAFKALEAGKTPDTLKTEGFKVETGKTNAADRVRAAAVVLAAFKEDEAFVAKVREKCHRPELVYPFPGESENAKLPLPACPKIFEAIELARLLRVKAAAELAAGNSAAALQDLDLVLCLSESLRNDPLLISGIGSVACLRISLKFPWEGLAARQFTAAELKQLQETLGSDNLIANIGRVCQSERASFLPVFDYVLEDPKRNWEIFASIPVSPVEKAIFSIMPSGWIRLDQVNFSTFWDLILSAASPASGKPAISPSQLDLAWNKVRDQISGSQAHKALNHVLISQMLMPKISEFAVNCTAAQVTRDQTKLACALERYFLKNRTYPEKLDPILPEFLGEMPIDPISGSAYGYARQPNGRYKIWSVGWNEKDDGGTPGNGTQYDNTGDWVWQYP